jgi:hypothetical protein
MSSTKHFKMTNHFLVNNIEVRAIFKSRTEAKKIGSTFPKNTWEGAFPSSPMYRSGFRLQLVHAALSNEARKKFRTDWITIYDDLTLLIHIFMHKNLRWGLEGAPHTSSVGKAEAPLAQSLASSLAALWLVSCNKGRADICATVAIKPLLPKPFSLSKP